MNAKWKLFLTIIKLLLLTTQQQLFKIKSVLKNSSRYVCYLKDCSVSVSVSNTGVCTQLSLEHNHNHAAPEKLIKELDLINNIKKCETKNLKRKRVRDFFYQECRKTGEASPSVAFPKVRRQLFRIRTEATMKTPNSLTEAKLLFDDRTFFEEYGTSKQNQQPF